MKRTVLLAIGVAVCVALAAVASTKRVMPGLAFAGVAVPVKLTDKTKTNASAWFRWEGRRYPLRMERLATVRDPQGGWAFGQQVDRDMQPILDEGEPRFCNTIDGVSIFESAGALWHMTHAECSPGLLQLSRLNQDDEGALSLGVTAPVDLSSVGGGVLFCAGEDSPWGTHLAAEEYDVDAATLSADGTDPSNHERYNNLAAYHGGSLEGVSPYDYAWVDEVDVLDAEGKVLVTKRTAMGRFSHEQAKVLADGRTVYLSDDGKNGGFFLFVADVAGDLSVGQLYASKWGPGPEGTLAALEWIPLGRASEAQIAPWLARGTAFTDLFEAAEPADGACPEGFGSINTTWKHECLKLVEGAELAASRLETRRYAALQGATTELSKSEGMAFDPDGMRLFLAFARIERGMTAEHDTYDVGGPDHMGWAKNPCGAVVSMALGTAVDTTGAAIDSGYVAGSVSLVLEGAPKDYEAGLEHNTCDLEAIAGPDNLEYMPEAGVLLIAEDTNAHDNNALWALEMKNGSLMRVLTVPLGGEVAGLQWYPDIGGRGYITVSVQNPMMPWGDPWWAGEVEGDQRSWTGWLGPFPQF